MKTVNQKITAVMEVGISSVLSGEEESFKSDFIHPQMVVDYMKREGWKKGDLDTNGWQYDWWIPFTKGELSFTARGSGYYGTFEFSKTEA